MGEGSNCGLCWLQEMDLLLGANVPHATLRRSTHSGLPVAREEPQQLLLADFPEEDFWPASIGCREHAACDLTRTGPSSMDYLRLGRFNDSYLATLMTTTLKCSSSSGS